MGNHETYGIAYRRVADAHPAGLGVVHPICATDYWPALAPLEQFVASTAELTYWLGDIRTGETIERIVVKRGDREIFAALGTNVEVEGQRLFFTPGFLEAGDLIRVTLRLTSDLFLP